MPTEPTEPEPRQPQNGGWRPVPDPSVLTTQQLEKAIETERLINLANRQVLTGRIDGIDKATELLAKSVEKAREDRLADIDHAITAVVGVINERFNAIAQQFVERDARSETVSTLNKVALDAAFAAQKEAAAEQNKSNTLAITKSETATTETINKNAELFRTESKSLADKIEDLKSRIGVTEAGMVGLISSAAGGSNATAESRDSARFIAAMIGLGITILIAAITVASFAIANK